MKKENKNISKLIDLVSSAADAYDQVCASNNDKSVKDFFSELKENHLVFVEESKSKLNNGNGPYRQNGITNSIGYDDGTTVDHLVKCKNLEKAILQHAREAVHGKCDRSEKNLLCRQLTYSEKALFKADQMLETYE